MAELVAGEAYDHQSLVLIFLVQFFQTVVLRGEAALGSGVHHKQHLALVIGKVNFLSGVGLGLELVDGWSFVAGKQAQRCTGDS